MGPFPFARALPPVVPPESRAHLALHGTPDTLEPRTHPGLPIPKDAPLPHIPGIGLKVQGPRDAAA